MTTASILDLQEQIERLVQQHVAAYEVEVRAALRGLASTGGTGSAPRRRKAAGSTKGKTQARRTPAEIAALGERFYAAVESQPGETMAVLVRGLGVSSRDLERPVSQLRKAERVRTVGERSRMRYFPMATSATAATLAAQASAA